MVQIKRGTNLFTKHLRFRFIKKKKKKNIKICTAQMYHTFSYQNPVNNFNILSHRDETRRDEKA